MWLTGVQGVNMRDMLGQVIRDVRQTEYNDNEALAFLTDEAIFIMYHEQDCCESVSIEEISGDFKNLIGHPLILSDESSNSDENACESATWTFYRLGTIKGTVDVRWYGSSNGYYSEGVSLFRVPLTEVSTFFLEN